MVTIISVSRGFTFMIVLLVVRIFLLWDRSRIIWHLILIGFTAAYVVCLTFLAFLLKEVSRKFSVIRRGQHALDT